MTKSNTSLSVADEAVAEEFRKVTEQSEKKNHELLRDLLEEDKTVNATFEESEEVELELSQEAKETRALVVGVLEAADQMDLKDDLIEMIEELRKQEMMEMNKKIVQQVMEKSRSGEPLNEADHRLLDMVTEIETNRDAGTAMSQIAEGLFGEQEEETTETTATARQTDTQSGDAPPDSSQAESAMSTITTPATENTEEDS